MSLLLTNIQKELRNLRMTADLGGMRKAKTHLIRWEGRSQMWEFQELEYGGMEVSETKDELGWVQDRWGTGDGWRRGEYLEEEGAIMHTYTILVHRLYIAHILLHVMLPHSSTLKCMHYTFTFLNSTHKHTCIKRHTYKYAYICTCISTWPPSTTNTQTGILLARLSFDNIDLPYHCCIH